MEATGLTCAATHTEAVRDPAPLVRLEPESGVDRDSHDLVGGGLGDLLDVHAAGLADHDHGAARRAVRDDADVQLALYVEGLLDQHGVDGDALRAGLEGHEPSAQHPARGLRSLGGG